MPRLLLQKIFCCILLCSSSFSCAFLDWHKIGAFFAQAQSSLEKTKLGDVARAFFSPFVAVFRYVKVVFYDTIIEIRNLQDKMNKLEQEVVILNQQNKNLLKVQKNVLKALSVANEDRNLLNATVLNIITNKLSAIEKELKDFEAYPELLNNTYTIASGAQKNVGELLAIVGSFKSRLSLVEEEQLSYDLLQESQKESIEQLQTLVNNQKQNCEEKYSTLNASIAILRNYVDNKLPDSERLSSFLREVAAKKRTTVIKQKEKQDEIFLDRNAKQWYRECSYLLNQNQWMPDIFSRNQPPRFMPPKFNKKMLLFSFFKKKVPLKWKHV